ncbi:MULTISPECIES: ComF family protein [Peptoniphilus]|uniref:ComF family protein n=1 Tax=Peptoniphilus TaxID=162289 RepID=UPI0001DA99DE|nr:MULTISPECIES: phosphoribosyltransferase family protein [Peptoniphilus]EFI41784.1 comF family protein [Peptoniphilus sp. oral taxon 386 str. F0131]
MINLFKKECYFCDSKEIFEYGICKNCYDNLKGDILFSKKLEYVDDVIVAFEYNNFLRDKMLSYKFKDKTYLYKFFSEVLTEKLFKEKLSMKYKNITCVPMHKNALKKRGYNQSELIAKQVAKNTLLEFVAPVEKIADVPEQAGIKEFFGRIENIKGVFRFAGEKVESIIIVDDVITTGATVNEMARVLKENGIKKVAALVAATSQNL